MGGLMVFIIGVLCAVGINGISPAQIGVVLSYSTLLTQTFGMFTRCVPWAQHISLADHGGGI